MAITMHLNGGLGNQLFNYAAARSLADRTGASLILDVSSYASQWGPEATRPLALHLLPVRARFRHLGPQMERRPLVGRAARYAREDLFARRLRRGPMEIGYFEGFSRLAGRTILQGHFISHRFFAGNDARIRHDLTPPRQLLSTAQAKSTHQLIASSNSVGVHVRRGDLLAAANQWLLLPDQRGYYLGAIAMMRKKLDKPQFFVFSDDLDWCRTTFAGLGGAITFVHFDAPECDRPVIEFSLLQSCRHHIIANSAFSWWTAWLALDPEKIVICPDRWDRQKLIDIDEIVPPSWCKLAV